MFRPLPEQQADTFTVVRPTNSLCDGGSDIDRPQPGTAILMFSLRDGVGDLSGI